MFALQLSALLLDQMNLYNQNTLLSLQAFMPKYEMFGNNQELKGLDINNRFFFITTLFVQFRTILKTTK